MSSPRTAKIARRAAMRTPPAAKRAKSVQRLQAAEKSADKCARGDGRSAQAKQLAAEVLPLPERGGATATEVMITASGLLKAANLAVFELGMWQSWTGR
jgi:hypothetical protein